MSKDEKDPKAKPEEVQRRTAKRRTALVVSIIKGETSPQEAARTHGLTVAEVEEWKERFLAGAENALRSHPRDGSRPGGFEWRPWFERRELPCGYQRINGRERDAAV